MRHCPTMFPKVIPFLQYTAIEPHRIERVAILAKSWGEWRSNHGPRGNNADCKPNHETIGKEMLYRVLLTIHYAMVVPESFSDEVKERIIKEAVDRLHLMPNVKRKELIKNEDFIISKICNMMTIIVFLFTFILWNIDIS